MTQPTNDIGKVIAKFIGGLSGGNGGNRSYTPIIKSIEALGMQVRVMPIALGGTDEPTDCVVIPAQELLVREYQLLSGVSSDLLLGNEINAEEAPAIETVEDISEDKE